MPRQAMPHDHASDEEVIQPHDDMLADTPAQAVGPAYPGDKAEAIGALREIGLRCCRCDLCGSGHGVVFGEGSAQARLMLVGEAPGEEEDRKGRPFQGRAGQMLDSLLDEAGINREEIWVTNTVKHRPTQGTGRRLANRAPRVPEIKACAIWRLGELEILKPRIVCCLGAVAAKAILGRDVRMTEERGQWLPFALPIEGMEDAQVILTYHPSYVMRQEGEALDRIKAQALADLRIIAARLREMD